MLRCGVRHVKSDSTVPGPDEELVELVNGWQKFVAVAGWFLPNWPVV